MAQEKGPTTATKGTMTDISMMQKMIRPTRQKSLKPPRRKASFGMEDRKRQSDLSDQDLKLVRRIWAKFVEPNKEEVLTLLFNEFFNKHPELADMFMRLDQVGLPDLNVPVPQFKDYHLGRVMARLRQIIDFLDKPEQLTKLMTKLGVLYAKIDMSSEYLDEFQNMLISTIKIAMNNKMHSWEETGLRKCFDMAFFIMEEASCTYYDLFVATTLKKK